MVTTCRIVAASRLNASVPANVQSPPPSLLGPPGEEESRNLRAHLGSSSSSKTSSLSSTSPAPPVDDDDEAYRLSANSLPVGLHPARYCVSADENWYFPPWRFRTASPTDRGRAMLASSSSSSRRRASLPPPRGDSTVRRGRRSSSSRRSSFAASRGQLNPLVSELGERFGIWRVRRGENTSCGGVNRFGVLPAYSLYGTPLKE